MDVRGLKIYNCIKWILLSEKSESLAEAPHSFTSIIQSGEAGTIHPTDFALAPTMHI